MPSRQNRNRAAPPSPQGRVMVKGKDDGCCGIYFLKNALHMFNFILLLSGATMVAVGVWTMIEKNSFATLLTSSCFQATTYLLIGTGAAIVLIVTVIGCVGICKENRCCLMTYAALLMLIFLLEASAGILAYMYEATLKEELVRNLNHTMLTTYKRDPARTVAIDRLHKTFRCCGAGSFEDWPYSIWLQVDNKTLNRAPDSCCLTESPGCAIRIHPSNIFYEGCVTSLEHYLREHLIILGAIALGLCCLPIFGIIFSCCLAKKIEEWEERKKTYWR